MKRIFNIGDKVLLTLAGEKCPRDLKRYDGKVYRVSAVKIISLRPNPKPDATSLYSRYYELEGVVSSVGGVPYGLLADWLIPVGDEL